MKRGDTVYLKAFEFGKSPLPGFTGAMQEVTPTIKMIYWDHFIEDYHTLEDSEGQLHNTKRDKFYTQVEFDNLKL